MIKNLALKLYVLSILFVPMLAVADTPKTILALTLELRFKQSGTDQYNLLMKRMADEGLDFNLEFHSLKRIWRGMDSNSSACAFPVSQNSVNLALPHIKMDDLIQSQTIDHVSYRAFNLPNQMVISSLDNLKGMKIGAWNGMPNELLTNNLDINFELTNNTESRVKMLYNKRVDAIFDFVPDIYLVIEKLGLEQLPTMDRLKIWGGRNGTHLVCHNTPENAAFVAEFDRVLNIIREKEGLSAILGPYADVSQ